MSSGGDCQTWMCAVARARAVHIGYFEREWEAAKAYDREAIKLRGANTSLNFPAVKCEVRRVWP